MAVRRDGNQSGSRKRKRRPVAPKPDVTLGGDRSKRTGYAKATTPKPTTQGHPSRGRPTVSGGTKKRPKTKAYKSPTPSIRKQRQRNRARAESQRALRRTRKALRAVGKERDTDTHIGPLNIEAELEGRGVVSKYAEKAKKVATSDIGRAGLRAGGLPTTGNEQVDKNLAKDFVDIPTQFVPGTYAVGASIKEAAQGRPQRGKRLIREAKMHDPIVLAARSVIEDRPDLLRRAGKEAKKHPGLTALEAYGAGAGVSRAAAAAARGGAKVAPTKKSRKTLRKIGNTKRAPAVAPGTDMRQHREWSRGLGAKAVQVVNEERKIRKARKLRQKAKRTKNTHEKDKLRQRAQQVDPRVMSNAQIKRRSAEHEDLAEHRRRVRVKNAKRDARVISKRGKEKRLPSVRLTRRVLKDKNEGVALLIAQNIVKPTRESLLAYKKQIDSATRGLSRAELKTNRTLSGQIGALLRQKDIDFDDLVARAQAFKAEVAPRQAALVERGIITPEEARMSPLVPYAVQEMGAKWNPRTRRLEVPEGRRAEPFDVRASAKSIERRQRKLARGFGVRHRSDTRPVAKSPEVEAAELETVFQLGNDLGAMKPGASRAYRELEKISGWRRVERVPSGWVLHGNGGQAKLFHDKTDVIAELTGVAKQKRVQRFEVREPDTDVLRRVKRHARAQSRKETVGRPLSAEEIEAHMKTNGVDPGVYVTQAPNQRGARNYYSSYHESKGVARKSRTGGATRKGTFEVNRMVAEEGLSRAENLIAAADNYGDWLGENMFRGRRGRDKADQHFYDTPQEARNVIANELFDSPYEWEVVSTRPMFGRKGQSEALAERADMRDPATDVDIHEGVTAALDGNGQGKFAIVPKAARNELRAHQQQSSMKALRAWKNVNRQFSGTVLTTSGFTWPLGNVGEGVLRLAVLRAGPASYVMAKKTVAEMEKIDPELAADFEYRLGSGYAGAFEMQRTHLSAKDLQSAGMDRTARAIGTFARTPGPREFGRVWGAWTDAIFGSNGWIEHQIRLTASGKYLKKEGFSPHWFKDGGRAMQVAAEQAAKGMKGTAEQIAAARFVDRAMGQYSKWTSGRRFAVGVFTPFSAWAVNAVKFFVDVLPRDHPILTGLLATSERATEEWRKSYGLGKFVDGAAPSWLQPSIVVDGKLVPVGRYGPAGAFADPLQTAGRQVLPQWNSIFLASLGLDWKGDVLNGKDRNDDVTDQERAQAMLKASASAFIPFFGLHQRLNEKGGTALNPVRGYEHNRKVTAAFNEIDRIKAEKDKFPDSVDANNPTPEYAKLHRRERALNERIFKLTKGKYGHKYKEPYRPKGSSDDDDGGRFDFGGPDSGKYDFND